MTGYAEAASSPPCSIVTQGDFQLHAIVRTLQSIEHAQRATSEQTDLPSRLDISCHGQSLTVTAATSNLPPHTRSLVLTPLFTGSYTQPDVAVQTVDTGMDSSRSACPVYGSEQSAHPGPIDPAFHYAQYSPLPASWKRRLKDSGKGTAVLLTNSMAPAAADAAANFLSTLPALTEIISKRPDCNIVVIDLQRIPQTNSGAGVWQQLRSRNSLNQYLRSLPVEVQRVRLPAEALTTLVTVLHQAELVHTPSLGLTIDALNSGCKVIMGNRPMTMHGYGEEHLDAARRAVAAEQMEHLQAQQLIRRVNELDCLLQNWLQPTGWSTNVEPLLTDLIIPPDTSPAHRRRSSLAAGKAKLRKLQRSPRQFFQDSRFPAMRKPGTP